MMELQLQNLFHKVVSINIVELSSFFEAFLLCCHHFVQSPDFLKPYEAWMCASPIVK